MSGRPVGYPPPGGALGSPQPLDPVGSREKYERDILPAIKRLTVPNLMAATGLSQHYCWQVRSERKRLHPMHWGRVVSET